MESGVLYVAQELLIVLQSKGQTSSNGHHTVTVLFVRLFEFIFPTSRNAPLERKLLEVTNLNHGGPLR